MNAKTDEVRILTPAELAEVIRLMRDIRKWSQDTLASLTGLTVRTIQRVESGEPSSVDTRRALAAAFGLDDIDYFNKPFSIPSPESIKAQQEAFDKDHVTLECSIITSGKQLAILSESSGGDVHFEATGLAGEAALVFAGLVDYIHEFRDCADLYSEVDKLEIHADLQGRLDELGQHGISVCCATRKVRMKLSGDDTAGLPTTVLYTGAFPKGNEPKTMIVQRQIAF
jgi:transcriptional regulator with XRE-family HTH domain